MSRVGKIVHISRSELKGLRSIGFKNNGNDDPFGTQRRAEAKKAALEEIFRKTGDSYTGAIDKEGRPHGHGAMVFASGSKFNGTFARGEMVDGQMTCDTEEGGTYSGAITGGRMIGRAVITYSNGDCFTGTTDHNGHPGHGTCELASGGKYSGKYVDGLQAGAGTWHFPDGTSWRGGWWESSASGSGTWLFADGTTSIGLGPNYEECQQPSPPASACVRSCRSCSNIMPLSHPFCHQCGLHM